ncbi:MAG: TPM domain-containing protein [Roseburia sp.]|nr:TPM domain-containing protein [Roseburia sp.]
MMKMWKKLFVSVFVSAMLLASVTVGATETEFLETEVVSTEVSVTESVESEVTDVVESYVYDYAGLLSTDEIAALESQIATMKEKTGWDVFAVTTNDAEGKSAMAYADDFYDEQTTEDSDGILVLIDMDNREIYISTGGEAIRYLTDARIERVLDDGFYYVSNGEYASCLSAMLSTAEYYYDAGIQESQYNYDVETGAVSEYRTLTWMEVIPVLLLAIGVGLAIYFMVVKSYSLKGGRYDYPYMKYGKLDLTAHEDHFIREHTTHHRIQTSSSSGGSHRSSGGRSSVHRSSSGHSHGGGGRRF